MNLSICLEQDGAHEHHQARELEELGKGSCSAADYTVIAKDDDDDDNNWMMIAITE